MPNLGGTWFMHGDPNLPCEVHPQPDGTVIVVNEKGEEAWGTLEGPRLFVPEWKSGGRRGLMGRITRDRIVWPDGNYWSRYPEENEYGDDEYYPRFRR